MGAALCSVGCASRLLAPGWAAGGSLDLVYKCSPKRMYSTSPAQDGTIPSEFLDQNSPTNHPDALCTFVLPEPSMLTTFVQADPYIDLDSYKKQSLPWASCVPEFASDQDEGYGCAH